MTSGYQPIRGDEVSGRIILQDIWQKINESAVIVADLTASNPNVFYELGIAHTIGRDVVPIAQVGQRVPFDQTPFRTIFYRADNEGMRPLRDSLQSFLQMPQLLKSPIILLKNSFVAEFGQWRRSSGLVLTARGENFQGARLDGVDLSDCVLSECVFADAALVKATFERSRLIRADFSNAKLENVSLAASNISESDFSNATLRNADLQNAIALRVNLSAA
ncbi:MAG: pentapeptide repeat-containing protein, partial [Hyphomicrobiaceae bacterium]